jgi:hypothetical protein
MLRSRTYLGEQKTTGGNWIAAHAPIIDGATFEQAAGALESRKLGGRSASDVSLTADWLLRAISTCACCGARMGASYGDRNKENWRYYACRSRLAKRGCSAPYVPVSAADAAAAALALARLEELRDELGAAPRQVRRKVTDWASKRAILASKRERTLDLAADGILSRDELTKRIEAIDTSLRKLDVEEAAEARANGGQTPAERQELLATVQGLQLAWRRASVAQRREILTQLARTIRVGDGGDVVIDWLTPVELSGQAAVGEYKCSPPFKEAEFDIRWGAGIDSSSDLIDFAMALGVVEKSGSHLSFAGEHLGQGRERAREAVLSKGPLAGALRSAVEAATPRKNGTARAAAEA